MEKISNKRELLRKKKIALKRKRWMTFGLIFLGVLFIFATAYFLPKLVMRLNKYESSEGFSLGDPDAPVSVELFSSYYCSFCKDYSEQNEKSFIADYVDTGKVFYRYVNLPPQSEQAILASAASYCAADQNRFFDYKEQLYNYAAVQDGFSAENLIKYANFIGMDSETFSKCLDADTYINAYEADRSYASSLGITFTPSFYVNGEIVTAAELIPTVEMLLSQQQ